MDMFSETINALTGFHGRLVSTHHLHFGNFLAAKIDDDRLRNQALAEMARALSTVEVGEEAASPAGQMTPSAPSRGDDGATEDASRAPRRGRLTNRGPFSRSRDTRGRYGQSGAFARPGA
jgi:hypothetical protein